jgi:hypothetical protein
LASIPRGKVEKGEAGRGRMGQDLGAKRQAGLGLQRFQSQMQACRWGQGHGDLTWKDGLGHVHPLMAEPMKDETNQR